jgi:hypothetical protein
MNDYVRRVEPTHRYARYGGRCLATVREEYDRSRVDVWATLSVIDRRRDSAAVR